MVPVAVSDGMSDGGLLGDMCDQPDSCTLLQATAGAEGLPAALSVPLKREGLLLLLLDLLLLLGAAAGSW